MADERKDQLTGNDNSPPTADHNEFAQEGTQADRPRSRMGNQGSEGSFGGESIGTQSGSADANGSTIAGGANAGDGLHHRSDKQDGMSGQPIGGNDSATGTGTTLTQGADFDCQAAEPVASTDRGAPFIGSPSSRPEYHVAQGQSEAGEHPSGADATEGSDFAKQGRGALDDEEGDHSGRG